MAQISIPMSNKVGYSMFWNSMWDNKINFSRSLKEDIYLNIFIPLIFDDNISGKVIKTRNFDSLVTSFNLQKYNLHLKSSNVNKSSFYKYISELNKLTFFNSKVWILKYQRWVIIYFFMYLPKYNTLKNNILKIKQKDKYANINKLFILYKTINLKLKYSFNFFDKHINKNYF